MIYTVTVLKLEPYRHRTWGYYFTSAEAEKAILENWTDLFEMGYYDLAVVEEAPTGIAVRHREISWFAADYSKDTRSPVVRRVERPEWASNICNFSFG